ncbi:MAG: patatin-like phospholipase family protein, partial [Bacteroidetes bacterium]|nr:patatin-like phospholipase family protein [Bacteroidota bacterium]
YLGKVDFFSYLVLGGSCGAFIMAFQIASYIVNSHRFHFLASVSRPFVKYTVNNFILPLLYILLYLVSTFQFQVHFEHISKTDIVLNLSGFVLGALFFYVLSLTYFFTVSKDIFKLFGIDILKKSEKKKTRRVQLKGNSWKRVSDSGRQETQETVETYISGFKIRTARDTAHYDKEMISRVFRQNHTAAAIFEIAVVLVLLFLGFFRDIPVFMIPAGASIFLSLTMMLMLASAIHTWLKSWSLPVFIILAIAINWLSGYEWFGKRNRAYGLYYDGVQAVLPDSMLIDRQKVASMRMDSDAGLKSLKNWKQKAYSGRNGKPVIVFLNVSGGGLKSALWTLYSLQKADSACQGRLMKNIRLISGSSGGMIGAAYYRELYLRSQKDAGLDIYNRKYADNISRDMLNPVGFSLAVNDVFLRLQRVQVAGLTYTRDRGYEFERVLHENTGGILNKPIISYADAEEQGTIPMMVFTPTIINDGRRLLISAQPVSYLTFTPGQRGTVVKSLPEDIEFRRVFREQRADSLRFSTAIRMSATFPYILPSVSLPSDPILEVMDAGFRDNYGIKTSMRYLFHFRRWILANTDKVVFLQIRENHKAYDLKTPNKKSIFELLSSPLGNVYENMFRIQDYQHDELVMYANVWFGGKIEFIELDMNPASNSSDEVISMNFHLTSLEKERVMAAIHAKENKAAVQKLKKLLSR